MQEGRNKDSVLRGETDYFIRETIVTTREDRDESGVATNKDEARSKEGEGVDLEADL